MYVKMCSINIIVKLYNGSQPKRMVQKSRWNLNFLCFKYFLSFSTQKIKKYFLNISKKMKYFLIAPVVRHEIFIRSNITTSFYLSRFGYSSLSIENILHLKIFYIFTKHNLRHFSESNNSQASDPWDWWTYIFRKEKTKKTRKS